MLIQLEFFDATDSKIIQIDDQTSGKACSRASVELSGHGPSRMRDTNLDDFFNNPAYSCGSSFYFKLGVKTGYFKKECLSGGEVRIHYHSDNGVFPALSRQLFA